LAGKGVPKREFGNEKGIRWLVVKNVRGLLRLEKKENSVPKYYAMTAT